MQNKKLKSCTDGDYADELDFPLPEGFHFVNPQDIDRTNVGKCCFKGFDHE